MLFTTLTSSCQAMLICGAGLLLLGCGAKDNYNRVIIEGTVEYEGKPVPKGAVWFVPDISVGTDAPTGFAVIQEGRYKTLQSKAPLAGRYTIKITGLDDVPPTQEELAAWGNAKFPGHRLFPEYKVERQINADSTQLDFQIPSKPAGRR
ncbi:hypothetical protein M4951_04255 [Blastopirellula sp. J2-11]|uniref:hypothetical protein n=1 Tax=Blastopirellula sp. J2-11 TaxID=2943192 RepID=UPI0021C8919B|nr:hypothetical protein [Blastopirellula sp. J2-11]UUO07524.1 hypothetical protein M4951_04255 [Blastopirellula sp. J2-11]